MIEYLLIIRIHYLNTCYLNLDNKSPMGIKLKSKEIHWIFHTIYEFYNIN